MDNILAEVMFDNFDNLGEVVAMEDEEYMEIFNRKKADE